jgi:hypothetical protein
MFKVISSAFSSREREIIADSIKYFPNVDFGKIGVFKEVGKTINAMFDARVHEIVLCGIRDDMSEDDFRFSLLHEMRHVEQYRTGRMTFGEVGTIWDGGEEYPKVLTFFLTDELYCQLPWELDANTFALAILPPDYVPTNPLLLPNVTSVQ